MITWNRRDFLVALGRLMLAPLAGWACSQQRTSGEPEPAMVPCQEPTDHQEETLLKLADTLVPGASVDPRGLPGAVESCPLEILYHPDLPVAMAASLVVTVLDAQARKAHGAEYKQLGLDERTEVTRTVEVDTPVLGYLFRFIRAIYYTSPVAYAALGYPGHNLGYIHHPDFSLREALGEEMTEDGNLP